MRNDARPIGPDSSDQSPIDAHQPPAETGETLEPNRGSEVVNQATERQTECEGQKVDAIQTVDLEGREL